MPVDQHRRPTSSAIYETLFSVNSIDGTVTPLLGTASKWSDGQAFRAAAAFNSLKQCGALAS